MCGPSMEEILNTLLEASLPLCFTESFNPKFWSSVFYSMGLLRQKAKEGTGVAGFRKAQHTWDLFPGHAKYFLMDKKGYSRTEKDSDSWHFTTCCLYLKYTEYLVFFSWQCWGSKCDRSVLVSTSWGGIYFYFCCLWRTSSFCTSHLYISYFSKFS